MNRDWPYLVSIFVGAVWTLVRVEWRFYPALILLHLLLFALYWNCKSLNFVCTLTPFLWMIQAIWVPIVHSDFSIASPDQMEHFDQLLATNIALILMTLIGIVLIRALFQREKFVGILGLIVGNGLRSSFTPLVAVALYFFATLAMRGDLTAYGRPIEFLALISVLVWANEERTDFKLNIVVFVSYLAVTISLLYFQGLSGSKSSIILPILWLFIVASAIFRPRRLLLWYGSWLSILALFALVAFSIQGLRNLPPGTDDELRRKVAVVSLLQVFPWASGFAGPEIQSMLSSQVEMVPGMSNIDGISDIPVLYRFAIGLDDLKLLKAVKEKGFYGLHQLLDSMNIIPRFIAGNPQEVRISNSMGVFAEVISWDDDKTGILFTGGPFLYSQGGYTALLSLGLFLSWLFFFVATLLFGTKSSFINLQFFYCIVCIEGPVNTAVISLTRLLVYFVFALIAIRCMDRVFVFLRKTLGMVQVRTFNQESSVKH